MTNFNTFRLTGGVITALGAGMAVYAAMSMDGGSGVSVLGVLVMSAAAVIAAGVAVLLAANRIEEAEDDRDIAEAIEAGVAGFDGCSGCSDCPDIDYEFKEERHG